MLEEAEAEENRERDLFHRDEITPAEVALAVKCDGRRPIRQGH